MALTLAEANAVVQGAIDKANVQLRSLFRP